MVAGSVDEIGKKSGARCFSMGDARRVLRCTRRRVLGDFYADAIAPDLRLIAARSTKYSSSPTGPNMNVRKRHGTTSR